MWPTLEPGLPRSLGGGWKGRLGFMVCSVAPLGAKASCPSGGHGLAWHGVLPL